MRHALYLGDSRALIRLASGEFLCLDTRSRDSLLYLAGGEYEPDIIRVFRTFLTNRSVVLDIGANVGLYTALSASIVGRRGRLFAFEANPQVFDTLQATIVCNGHWENPNITAVNRLVADRCGQGKLFYDADWLGGGTMSDVPFRRAKRRSAMVPMITIDDFLPPDLAVDLVKIDVEGHEPAVMRGMEQTIARSPNIRLVIEFADHLLAQHHDPAEFVDYIRGLGLGICRIHPEFRIKRVGPDEAIAGFNYLLLTRTPDADVAAVERRRNYPPIRLKRWLNRYAWGRYRRIWGRY
jgi:FkbM family methyltransferase